MKILINLRILSGKSATFNTLKIDLSSSSLFHVLPMYKELSIAILIWTLLPWALQATEETEPLREFVLINGDKITGQVVSETEETLVIENALLGTLELPRASIVPPEPTQDPMAISPEEAEAISATSPIVPSKHVLPFLNLPKNWEGRFSVGNSWQSGRSKKMSLDLRGQLTVKEEKDEYQYSAFYRFEETNHNVSSDRWGLGFRYRRDLGPHNFIQANTTYESDRIKHMDNHLLQTLGYGFRLIENTDFHINLVPGIALEYIDQRGSKSNTNFLLNFYQDMHWNIDPRFALTQSFNFFFNPNQTREYRFLFKSGITGAITETVRMDISYEFEYDNSVARSVSKHDSRLISAIVLAF